MPSRARRIGRVLLVVLAAIAALVVVLASFVHWKSERGMNQRLEVAGEELEIPTDPESIARGQRLTALSGCLDCHGADAAGSIPIDALPVMQLHAPNLTKGGPTADWSGRDWARAVRHGVRPDGSVLLFMPTVDFRNMADRDLGPIVAYLRSLPASTRDVGPSVIGPLGRALYAFGELPLIPAENTDHVTPLAAAPEPGPTAEFGAYLANSCRGCHGDSFSGGKIPGAPPEWPAAANLTPERSSGIGAMSLEQFTAALTRGQRADGTMIDPTHMPWRGFANFTQDEVAALFTYFHSLPALPDGGR